MALTLKYAPPTAAQGDFPGRIFSRRKASNPPGIRTKREAERKKRIIVGVITLLATLLLTFLYALEAFQQIFTSYYLWTARRLFRF
jgi:hypothetical protein